MEKSELAARIKRTKIITTIGPATSEEDQIEKLFESGMNTIRLNFSHGTHEEQGARIETVKALRKRLGKPISIMLDTKGPEIRVGRFKDGAQQITSGQRVTIYTDAKSYATKECISGEMTVAYDMSADLKKDNLVLVDDGKLEMRVESVRPEVVECIAVNSHIVKTNKRVNLPGVDFSMPFLSDKDRADIMFGCEKGIDYIAASFVNSALNIEQIREITRAAGHEEVQIIAKIESALGIENLDEIIAASDGIMVARGDLSLEIDYYDVPYWEKIMIRKCREAGKPVIVATQMLESMTKFPIPTRAEVSDVYFAAELGSDATMLSGETADGDFPSLATSVMATIDKRAEVEFYNKVYYPVQLENARQSSLTAGLRGQIASSLAERAQDGQYQFAIVLSRTGKLLKMVSKFRPNVTILGVAESDTL